jgi:hypothetical protein
LQSDRTEAISFLRHQDDVRLVDVSEVGALVVEIIEEGQEMTLMLLMVCFIEPQTCLPTVA